MTDAGRSHLTHSQFIKAGNWSRLEGSLAGQLEAALPARVPLWLGVLLPLLLLTESLPLLPLQEVQPGQLSTGGRDTGFILGSNIICCRKYFVQLKS